MIVTEDPPNSSVAVPRSWLRGSQRSFDIAARSLSESQLVSGDAAADGALHHHWSGLFQFAAIRVGAESAAELLEALRIWAERELGPLRAGSDGARVGPLLYRELWRRLGADHRRLAADAPEWWVPPDPELAGLVLRVRRGLTPAQQAALEICHCRGLDLEEGAFVLDLPKDELERELLGGHALLESLLGDRQRERVETRERVLLQAFALDPRRVRAPARPRRQPVLEVGSVVHDRYEIEAPLGAGAFADVYRARDRDVTGHVVALKILRRPAADPHAVRAALRELQLIASVFHPSVVQLKDHGWYGGHLWFVMPLYRGETLAQRLEKKQLSRREARDIFEVLAEALVAMHRAGVRHQDIKPENVFLASIGPAEQEPARILPVLLDLGVAAKDVELVLAGTPAYFAPEIAARFSGMPDPPAVGPKADVFSLALTLRDALDPTPHDYVAAAAVDAFVSFRARHAPRPPSRPELADLHSAFERWLNRQPDARPDAEQFRRELAILTLPDERRRRRRQLLRWLVPTVLATAALFLSVIVVLSKEAALRRTEALEERGRATRAARAVASMHADLELQEAMRQRLQAEVAELEARYQNSRLTREELATRLAASEGEASLLEARRQKQLGTLRKEADELRALADRQRTALSALEGVRDRQEDLARELDRTRASLEQERLQRVEAEALSAALGTRLEATQALVDRARSNMAELVGLVAASEAASGAGSAAAPAAAVPGAQPTSSAQPPSAAR